MSQPGRRARRAVPRVLAITPPDGPVDGRFEAWLGALAEAGVDGVQIRRKDLPDRELLALVERARVALAGSPVALLVNGRADVALAAGLAECAGGVHLPAAGLATAEVRRLFEARDRRLVIGRSTHRLEEIARERAEGADYVTFGPVYPTPGKGVYGEPVGLDGLRRACAAGVPVLALGGIDPERVSEAAAAGASGVAAIRACSDRGRLGALVAAVRSAFPAGSDPRLEGCGERAGEPDA